MRIITAQILLLLILSATTARPDALNRLQAEKLEALHQAIKKLHRERNEPTRPGAFKDFRANLHVHSKLSHDSRGGIEEIVAAAKKVGTSVLMFTEHPADSYDYFTDGHRGIREGVLLIPGAETRGFLVFPRQSLRGLDAGTPQEFADVVRGRGGMLFLSHLEERMDWQIRGLTGTEIYNTHADFKDEKALIAALRDPLWLFQAAELFRKYPQEAFSALLDYPADYLHRWDQLCQASPHTGVAANDSHQNVGLVVRLLDGEKARLEDALGKRLFDLDVNAVPALQELRKDKKPGEVIFDLRLDRYEFSLRHVGTHLLLTELSEKAVWDALEAGRVFVAFDWLADSTGFDFFAVSGDRRFEMGSRLTYSPGLILRAQAPLAVDWKLICNGKTIAESTGTAFERAVTGAGIHRIEAWLTVAGEKTIWILPNPFYVQAPGK